MEICPIIFTRHNKYKKKKKKQLKLHRTITIVYYVILPLYDLQLNDVQLLFFHRI